MLNYKINLIKQESNDTWVILVDLNLFAYFRAFMRLVLTNYLNFYEKSENANSILA